MCGIAGMFSRSGAPADEALLRRMTDLQFRRGPDDGGLWRDGPVGLGHRRLSILDLSSAGHQPMESVDGRYVLTFNGEIYNYIELRKELSVSGHQFRTATDTEVLIAAYAEWGPACVERFLGMWAFALWDRRERQLFCSRDPFGIKPLFYYDTPEVFYFASDIRALLLVDDAAKAPDWTFLSRQLSSRRFRRVTETSFENVRALHPGSNMTITGRGTTVSKYWSFSLDRARSLYDYGDPVGTFRELLVDSVRMHFRSDVPVGVCLSGGLDSSTIVALASREMGTRTRTFSIVYPDTQWAEDEYVAEVNDAFECIGSQATPPGHADFLDTLNTMVAAHGEPDQGIGVYSQWKVMELAQGAVTVLLDGQGGDELLAGYPFYYATYIASLIRRGRLLKAFGEYRAYQPYATSDFGRAALKRAFPGLERMVRRSRGDRDRVAAVGALHVDVRQHLHAEAPVSQELRPVPSDRLLAEHMHGTIQSDLLQSLLYFEDRNSMAFSLEARVPFLDRRLVEFCLGLPADQLLRDGYTKSILRRAMEPDLPRRVLLRRDKKGFPTPFAHWLRSGLMPAVRTILLDQRTRDRRVLDMRLVEQTCEAHESRRADHSVQIFNWCALELWFRNFHDAGQPGLHVGTGSFMPARLAV